VIGLLFSLTFMMVNLMIQVVVWTFRLTFLMIKLAFELVESLSAAARN
jgi:hypothetical protein